MRTIFILISFLWIGVASLALAQSQEKQEYPCGKERNLCPTDNRSNATVTIQFPSHEHTGEPHHNPAQSDNDFSANWTMWATWIIAIFTIVLVIVAWLQRQTYQAILSTTKVTERAYINVSPSPPDQNSLVAVEIKNYGETPATITAIAIYDGKELPRDPNNPGPPDEKFSGYFLVRGVHFFHWIPWPGNISGTQYFLYGYVDYMTVFNQRHRSGFARVYDPMGKQFMFVSQGGYNYDRPRKKGEGNDWEEQPPSN